MKKAISVVLLIAAVALGAKHGHYTYLRSNGYIEKGVGFWAYFAGDYEIKDPKLVDAGDDSNDRKPFEEPKPSEGEPAPPRRIVEETTKPHVEETRPPEQVVDPSLVAAYIKEGRELYVASDYKEAGKKFSEAAGVLEKALKKNSPQYVEASRYAGRCRVFEALVNNIPFLELSDGRNLSQIELESGKTIIARVVKDDGDSVSIQQNDGIEATLSYDQIDEIKPLPPDDYRNNLVKAYRDRLSKVDAKSYFDVFGVALFAIQNRLKNEISNVLEQTFMLPGSELVLQTFYTGDDADQLIVALLESFDKKQEAESYRNKITLAQAPPEPDPVPMPDPDPIDPGPGPERIDPGPPPAEPVARPTERSTAPPGSTKAKLDEAGQYFAAGQRFANYATRNVSKRNFYGKKAHEELGKARDILNILQDQNPGDMEIENMLQQVSDLLHFVIHNLVGTN